MLSAGVKLGKSLRREAMENMGLQWAAALTVELKGEAERLTGCRRVRDCVGNERAAGGGGGEGGDSTLSSTAAWHTKRGARPVSRRRQ